MYICMYPFLKKVGTVGESTQKLAKKKLQKMPVRPSCRDSNESLYIFQKNVCMYV